MPAHRLAGDYPDGQYFLPLHGHTPGQQPVPPADALATLLLTAGLRASHIPADLAARAGLWRDHLAGKKILLVLDDATGHEQVRPLLPGTAGSLVLITSRRRLAALEDAAPLSLDTLPPDDAIALLARLAGRPDLGRPGRPARPAVRVPAAGYRPGGPAAVPSPSLDRRGPGRRPGRGPGPAGADAGRERVRGRRVRPVLPRPGRRPAAAVPPPRPASRAGHRRARRRRAGRHQPGPGPPPPR